MEKGWIKQISQNAGRKAASTVINAGLVFRRECRQSTGTSALSPFGLTVTRFRGSRSAAKVHPKGRADGTSAVKSGRDASKFPAETHR